MLRKAEEDELAMAGAADSLQNCDMSKPSGDQVDAQVIVNETTALQSKAADEINDENTRVRLSVIASTLVCSAIADRWVRSPRYSLHQRPKRSKT